MREQAASDKPVALAISLSEKASRFGAISRLNHVSSRWAGCSRALLRLRRYPSLIVRTTLRWSNVSPERGEVTISESVVKTNAGLPISKTEKGLTA